MLTLAAPTSGAFRQRAGLVTADHRGGAQGLHRRDLAHQHLLVHLGGRQLSPDQGGEVRVRGPGEVM